MMYLLLVVSAVALVVFVERLLHYHRAQINSSEFKSAETSSMRP